MEAEKAYIRADLQRTEGGQTAYYRLNKDLVDFLNLLKKKGMSIEAITLDIKEDGTYGYNIGFVVTNIKAKKGN